MSITNNEELFIAVEEIKSTSVVLETLLAELLDANKTKGISKVGNIDEGFLAKSVLQLSDALSELNNLNIKSDFTKIQSSIENLNKLLSIKEEPYNDKNVLIALKVLENTIKINIEEAKNNRVTIFGGNNAAMNYQRVLFGCGVLILLYLGFSFLPGYFLQKQELDENYQALKIYVDSEKMYEFYKTGDTKEFDKLNQAITKKDSSFLTYYMDLKSHWDKEHEKAELTKKIKEQQEKLKKLQ